MFLDYVKNKYKEGAISIGLPTVGHGNNVSVVANDFITRITCLFLSSDEKHQLADLSKADAMEYKNSGDRK